MSNHALEPFAVLSFDRKRMIGSAELVYADWLVEVLEAPEQSEGSRLSLWMNACLFVAGAFYVHETVDACPFLSFE